MNNNEYKGYAFATPEYSYRIEPNPTTKDRVFLSAETPDAIEMAIDSIELAGTQEGEYAEDLILEMNGDAEDAYCFFVEVSKPTLALFVNFELLNFLGATPANA
jgi:hypothetical protein